MSEVKKSLIEGAKACAHLLDKVEAAEHVSNILRSALKEGRTVFIMGYGQLAFVAHHIASEFEGSIGENRETLPVVALTDDNRLLAMVGNDYGSRHICLRLVATFVRKGDILMTLCESSDEEHVRDALRLAREKGAVTLLVTGKDGGKLADVSLEIRQTSSLRIEECQLVLAHAIFSATVAGTQVALKPATSGDRVIRFRCGFCGGEISALTRFAGRAGICPHCTVNLTIPTVVEKEKAAPSPAPSPSEQRAKMRFSVKGCALRVRRAGSTMTGDDKPRGKTVLENLSQGGLQFLLQYDIPPGSQAIQRPPEFRVGEEVRLKIQVPAFEEPITATGVVKRVEAGPSESQFAVGVQFVECDRASKEKLKKLEESAALRNAETRTDVGMV